MQRCPPERPPDLPERPLDQRCSGQSLADRRELGRVHTSTRTTSFCSFFFSVRSASLLDERRTYVDARPRSRAVRISRESVPVFFRWRTVLHLVAKKAATTQNLENVSAS